ncbi:hypothetical protein [Fodinibius sediminis]|nr:hypothetical protein [Fodinibius sediminis]
MIELSGTAYFWFIALGSIIGFIFGRAIKREGIPLVGNIIWGIAGSVISGSIGIILGLGDGLLFALAGTFAFLFLANVFHQHHKDDVEGEVNYGIHIKRKGV